MNIIIKQPKTDRDFQDYYDLRWRILRLAHDQPRGSEKDDLEELSIHLMAYYEEKMQIHRKDTFSEALENNVISNS